MTEADEHWLLLHEVPAAAVPDELQHAAVQGIAYAESILGAIAEPADPQIHWFIVDASRADWLPHLLHRGLRIAVRANQSLNGYCTAEGQLWLRVDGIHGIAENQFADAVGDSAAHEVTHRFQFLNLGHPGPPSDHDEQIARTVGHAFLLRHVPGAEEMVARAEATMAEYLRDQPGHSSGLT